MIEFCQIWKYLCKLSLAFASGYINTGSHFLILNLLLYICNILFAYFKLFIFHNQLLLSVYFHYKHYRVWYLGPIIEYPSTFIIIKCLYLKFWLVDLPANNWVQIIFWTCTIKTELEKLNSFWTYSITVIQFIKIY